MTEETELKVLTPDAYRTFITELENLPAASPQDSELFIKALWQLVYQEETTCQRLNQYQHQPGFFNRGDIQESLLIKFLEAGLSPQDIARYTKVMQYKLLSELLHLLDNPHAALAKVGIDETVHWSIFMTKRNQTERYPKAHMHNFHTLFTGLDPSGRKMEPPTTLSNPKGNP